MVDYLVDKTFDLQRKPIKYFFIQGYHGRFKISFEFGIFQLRILLNGFKLYNAGFWEHQAPRAADFR